MSVFTYDYCNGNPVMSVDPSGYFVIKRWMVSAPVDLLLSVIPGIGAAFAPIKSLAKKYGRSVLKNKIKTPLASFIRFLTRSATKIITSIQKNS